MGRMTKINIAIAKKMDTASFPLWYIYYRLKRFLKYEVRSDKYLIKKCIEMILIENVT